MTVSERAEDAFLAYILELAREAASSQHRQVNHDETAKTAPEGARKKG